MLGNYQKYAVNVQFCFEAEVFPEDPDDVYELAELEERSVAEQLSLSFSEVDIKALTVEPVIEG